jgi:transposase-like protein
MSKETAIKMVCPYCETEQEMYLPDPRLNRAQRFVINCEPAEGGCDRNFVFEYYAVLRSVARKIEGEEHAD